MRDLNVAVHLGLDCRGDQFCRCSRCKPPLSARHTPSNRVVVGCTGLALVIVALLAHSL